MSRVLLRVGLSTSKFDTGATMQHSADFVSQAQRTLNPLQREPVPVDREDDDGASAAACVQPAASSRHVPITSFTQLESLSSELRLPAKFALLAQQAEQLDLVVSPPPTQLWFRPVLLLQ